MKINSFKLLLITFLLLIGLSVSASDLAFDSIERVSLASDGVTQGDNRSYVGGLSADGNYTLFYSSATNLVPGDTNAGNDIFLYDRSGDILERVSVDSAGNQATGSSNGPSISLDARYIAFSSSASDLVVGDTNGLVDIFIHDRILGITERLLDGAGIQADNDSSTTSLSADGRYVAFSSRSSNLVPGDTNDRYDIFIYDRVTNAIERASISDLGVQSDAHSYLSNISSDGNYVTFYSTATTLVPGDTNALYDVFVYDVVGNTIERVSIDNAGNQANGESRSPFISSDGKYVSFVSAATNLVAGDTNGKKDIFIYNRDIDVIERISVDGAGVQGNGDSSTSGVSEDGKYITFASQSSNLVPGYNSGQWHIYVFDFITKEIEIVSIDNNGVAGTNYSAPSVISPTGEFILFQSDAANLVLGDTNAQRDIFFVTRLGAGGDITPPTLTEVIPVTTPTRDTTPDYTLNSDEEGTITYGGDCSSITGTAINGDNTITFNTLAVGLYSNCTVVVTDASGNTSLPLDISNFIIKKKKKKKGGHVLPTEEVVIETNLDTKECPHFTQYFEFGDKSNEIMKLQTFLQEQGFNTGELDSIMGPITFSAIKEFQNKYSNEILKPWNLAEGTGRWYQTTRHKANELIGCSEGELKLDNGVVLN